MALRLGSGDTAVMICADPLEWKRRVCLRGCAIHDDPLDCEPPLQAAHVISKQALKSRGLQDYLWDTRNGLSACYKAHRRSDSAVERFPRSRIPEAAEAFALELGIDYLLDRYYGPREDW